MSITIDKYTPSGFCVSSLCNDRVIPVSVSPIEFARGNGSNNMHKYPPLQISKHVVTSKEYSPKMISRSIPTIKLK